MATGGVRRGGSAAPPVCVRVAHQLTITGFREPGYLWKLGIPSSGVRSLGHRMFLVVFQDALVA